MDVQTMTKTLTGYLTPVEVRGQGSECGICLEGRCVLKWQENHPDRYQGVFADGTSLKCLYNGDLANDAERVFLRLDMNAQGSERPNEMLFCAISDVKPGGKLLIVLNDHTMMRPLTVDDSPMLKEVITSISPIARQQLTQFIFMLRTLT